jgi:hypothetical protein
MSLLEIHAHQSIKQGKAKFALTDIAVTNSVEEEDAYSNKGYKHVASLKPFGFDTSVFVLAKEPVDDDELFDFGTLSGNEWFDKRLIKCVKTFNLTEDDVMKFRWRFEKIQGDAVGMVNYIRVNDIFKSLGISIFLSMFIYFCLSLFQMFFCRLSLYCNCWLDDTSY